jgi:hypothetical protein
MKIGLILFIALLGVSPAAFGDLLFVLDPPATAVYPPGADQAGCDAENPSGLSAPCVQFSGTLTDTDLGNTLITLPGIALMLNLGDDAYFTIDNTFYDYTSALGGAANGAPTSYTGLIFGVDIAPSTPVGVYVEFAEISVTGGDANYNLFPVDAQFTIDVVPEPRTGLLILPGLLVLVALRRVLRPRKC